MNALSAQLIAHEGLQLFPYRDTVGKLSIGVGRNLDDVGISKDEALAMLTHDITRVEHQLREAFPWYGQLDEVRTRVLIDMGFNLGLGRLKGFKRMLASVARGDYTTASSEMLASLWAKQVGQRAIRLSTMMRTGALPKDLRDA